ncbi:hypothetical protein H6G97_32565 [Nostoc flagelliforme FACHB-838]|uniref:Transposase n=1 Tax=Nostoc flagelliforme FACHB-838 TaxID=2692904 RepID=A0ABR8DXP1_9NOSO|nr:hypothetical protein [Nostoc flagelliforme]MBD2534019.1 hypothetical protein [Nostoc flagelliforme FACHB-838]
MYLEAGYKNFEEYCQSELSAWGDYRRINQLLGAKKVIDIVGKLGGHIRNERQACPLLRLVPCGINTYTIVKPCNQSNACSF